MSITPSTDIERRVWEAAGADKAAEMVDVAATASCSAAGSGGANVGGAAVGGIRVKVRVRVLC